MNEIGVGYVNCRFVGGKANSVGSSKAICNDSDIACRWVEAVDELGEYRSRTETLFVAVYRVGEPDGTVRVDDDIVW